MIDPPRILLIAPTCYLDETDEAAGSRALANSLVRVGVTVEVLSGAALEFAGDVDLEGWLRGHGGAGLVWSRETIAAGDAGGSVEWLRAIDGGVAITIHRGPSVLPHQPDDAERAEFRHLFNAVVERAKPDMVVAVGDGPTIRNALKQARERGIATVAVVGGLADRDPLAFEAVDAVLAPSTVAATYYREAFGVWAEVASMPVDPERVRCRRSGPGYLVFVDPTPEHGVDAFLRIARCLGECRPDIPVLVVEGRGTEATLADRGLDLRPGGNVQIMSRPSDPRQVWSVARVCVAPLLGWRDRADSVVEAILNGVPLITSDRGGLPELVGEAGLTLPLPGWLTPATQLVPTAAEVADWVEAIIQVWDDADRVGENSRADPARVESWSPAVLGGNYLARFAEVVARRDRRAAGAVVSPSLPGRGRSIVLVPHLNGIEWECEQSLRRLEQAGIKVWRRGGSSAIDMARNVMVSDSLHDGYESLMFIDADLGFDPADVLRLLARPEPAICGVYAKKGNRSLAGHFAPGVVEVLFGPDALGLYPVEYAATGFLRLKANLLRRLIAELNLALCNTKWGRGVWPFFLPLIVPHDGDKLHYLGEDWAFSHRLNQINTPILADTSARLWHWGRYGYGWEDAGAERVRYRSYNYRLASRETRP